MMILKHGKRILRQNLKKSWRYVVIQTSLGGFHVGFAWCRDAFKGASPIMGTEEGVPWVDRYVCRLEPPSNGEANVCETKRPEGRSDTKDESQRAIRWCWGAVFSQRNHVIMVYVPTCPIKIH